MLEFDSWSRFEYCRQPFGPCSFGSWLDLNSTERVVRSRWQNLSALPATLEPAPRLLAPGDSTYVLLTTNIGATGLEFSRDALSLVVQTSRGSSVSVSYLDIVAVPRLRAGDSLRVVLALDDKRVVPRAIVNPVSSQWLRVADEANTLHVFLDADTRAFNYRVVNDTLRATRRGWRWGLYEYTPDSQLNIDRSDLRP